MDGAGRVPGARGAGARRGRNPVKPHLSVRAVDQDVCRLDVLMNEPALVEPAQRDRDADRKAKAAPQLQGRDQQPVQRLAAGILEHQRDLASFADDLHRAHRPGGRRGHP